jgi:hypothetical protein
MQGFARSPCRFRFPTEAGFISASAAFPLWASIWLHHQGHARRVLRNLDSTGRAGAALKRMAGTFAKKTCLGETIID